MAPHLWESSFWIVFQESVFGTCSKNMMATKLWHAERPGGSVSGEKDVTNRIYVCVYIYIYIL